MAATSYHLPDGRGDKSLSWPKTVQAQLIAADPENPGEFKPVATAPLGAFQLFNAPRMCGDWYCEIRGDRFVSATGPTQQDACRAAVAKLEAA